MRARRPAFLSLAHSIGGRPSFLLSVGGATGATTIAVTGSFSDTVIDLETGQLFDGTGRSVPLSEGEFQLLRVFVEHPRQVLDRGHLLDRVYGDASEHFDRSIDVQLCRLRRKLSASGLKGPVIRTIRNEGYMFVHAVTH